MITEDYVSFETAKLFKEKGFDEPCKTYYSPNGFGPKVFSVKKTNSQLEFTWEECVAPELSVAIKWLMQTYKVLVSPRVEVEYDEDEKGIRKYNGPGYYAVVTDIVTGNTKFCQGNIYTSPEEACKAAVEYFIKNMV